MAATVNKQVKTVSVAKPTIFFFPYRTKCIILCVLCFVFYANSIPNKYALDDSITMEQNAYVQMGFSGIPKILITDALSSFFIQKGNNPVNQEATGGRYRPLSQVVFAIEQQLFGGSEMLPYIRHFINILAYMACILAIFYFLERFLFRKISWGKDAAFLATALFVIHPIHTEVVDNIKSLDEILSMLFIMLTFIYSLKYLQGKNKKHLIVGVVSYLLALLSKEYAVVLIFFIPFLFYILENEKPIPALIAGIPYYIVFAAYVFLRYEAVGFHKGIPSADIVTNPYLYASHAERVATEWFVLGKYIALLFYPYPLSSDYSCASIIIKYHTFSDISVLLSIVMYVALAAWGVILALKKNILSFAVFFFLLNVFMISNFVIDIGGAMGQRLIFSSSVSFVIILSYYLFKWISNKSLQLKKNISFGILSLLAVASFAEVVVRNSQWKDNNTLFIHEAFVEPRSYMLNNNAAWTYLSLSEAQGNTVDQAKAYLDSAYRYSKIALRIKPDYDAAFLNLGAVYFHWGLSGEKPWGVDSAKYCWDLVRKINPNNTSLQSKYVLLGQYYFQRGMGIGPTNPVQSIAFMRKALTCDSTNADIWYNMGGAYFSLQKYDSAAYAWNKTLQINPNNADAQRGLQALASVKKN